MKLFTRMALASCLVFPLAGLAAAQQAVAPPPRPADSGPSLAVTMQFIQEKLNHLGVVNYVGYNHDNIDGSNWTNSFSTETTNVTADPATCRISYHEKRIKDGNVTSDKDFTFNLSEIQEVVIMPREQLLKKVNTRAGHPSWDARIDPPVSMLVVRKAEDTEWYFYFFDEDLANRVAKAMVHGVELCGGGNKSPF
ncbi:MAG TPA: hypothetical protein VKF63_01350 [Terracidiphilus sp.]|nr:hypothetical protein [Terracidiphilus sp.]